MTPAEILASARPDNPRRLVTRASGETWRPFRVEDVYRMVRDNQGIKI